MKKKGNLFKILTLTLFELMATNLIATSVVQNSETTCQNTSTLHFFFLCESIIFSFSKKLNKMSTNFRLSCIWIVLLLL